MPGLFVEMGRSRSDSEVFPGFQFPVAQGNQPARSKLAKECLVATPHFPQAQMKRESAIAGPKPTLKHLKRLP